VPEYDITADGIMVHCKANEKYMELSKENRLGINETILKQFRDAERADVIRIMELANASDSFTSTEVQEVLEKTKPTVARLIKKMCDKCLLSVIGAGRSTRYQKSNCETN